MDVECPTYLSYLLRLWRVDGDEGLSVWRASLESSRTGERRTFASLDDLFEFLSKATNPPPDSVAGPMKSAKQGGESNGEDLD